MKKILSTVFFCLAIFAYNKFDKIGRTLLADIAVKEGICGDTSMITDEALNQIIETLGSGPIELSFAA
jgi:hypothetical protein